MEPIVVEVTRGDVVEARHVVHAVAVRDGQVVLEAGDRGVVTFFRSSAKPLQALLVVRTRTELDDEEIALACASHGATPEQVAVVRRMLARAPATEDDLECGGAPTAIEHPCSGKHAGFLALCRARDWPLDGYHLADHACQRAVIRETVAAMELDRSAIATGIDGCGVVTLAVPLERMASAYERLGSLEAGDRIVRAMRAHPELISGTVRVDTELMRAVDGWVAKYGAEGLLCASSADGLGIAVKVLDGSFRALAPAVAHVLERLGVDASGLGGDVVTNSRGETVGALRVVSG